MFSLLGIITSFSIASSAAVAPDGPGIMGTWSYPQKDGFLATYAPHTKLWATIANGILTETYFPTLDRANSRDTQLLFVVNGRPLEERKDFSYKVQRFFQTLAYEVFSVHRPSGIEILKQIVLDPERPVVVMKYQLRIPDPQNTKVFVLHNPAADNTAGGDEAYIDNHDVISFQIHKPGDEHPSLSHRAFQLLRVDHPVVTSTVGFEGVNGPWEQIHERGFFATPYQRASFGNVAAGLMLANIKQNMTFSVALSFQLENTSLIQQLKSNAQVSLMKSASQLIQDCQRDWGQYLQTLSEFGRSFQAHVLILKGLEDKTHKGAIIAAPSLPWLPVTLEAPELNYEEARKRESDFNGGYHRVWPRDLYHIGLGLLAAGDTKTPVDILKYFRKIQLPDGSFPQNTWVDGTMSWGAYQLDQTGFAISFTQRLVEMGLVQYSDFRDMVVRAAESIVSRGPFTGQERWEEIGGLSPNSIAVACEGLENASWLEGGNSKYFSLCQKWKTDVFKWTYVNQGPLGSGYFERIEIGDKSIDPNVGSIIKIANEPASGNTFLETEIIDGGFIQWIISGLLDGLDPRITSSLRVLDQTIRGPARGGAGYFRYNHDGYGLEHRGRVWPLLSGERALASLVRGENPSEHVKVLMENIEPSEVLCEQTAVSACPLAWAHASVLITQKSLREKRSFYTSRR